MVPLIGQFLYLLQDLRNAQLNTNARKTKNYLIFNFVVTPRNFIIAKLSIRKPGSSSVSLSDFISTDEDPGLQIESFAIIKLRGVTTKLNIIFFHHANFQGIKKLSVVQKKIFATYVDN